jgi:hypothetical protein
MRGWLDDVPGLDTSTLEWAAIPWSYAAAVEIGIEPALVFHAALAAALDVLDARLGLLPLLLVLALLRLVVGERLA